MADVLAVGQVYKNLNDLMGKYYKWRNQSFMFIDKFRNDLKEAGNEMYKKFGTDFPQEMYGEMASVLGMWFLFGFDGTELLDTTEIFQKLFRMHKEYLNVELNESNVQALIDRSDEECKNMSSYVVRMYRILLRELDRKSK